VISVEPDRLVQLAAESQAPACHLLIDAVNAAGETLTATRHSKASDLLEIYRVRLARWRDEGIPASIGLAEFVSTLGELGDAEVTLAGYEGLGQTFVLLLSASHDALLGCIAISEPGDTLRHPMREQE
jgi:hypothetical protein